MSSKESGKNSDLDGSLPVERALGIYCDIGSTLSSTKKPVTRRGIPSIISSIYNLFVAPYTVKGKKLLQQLCQDKVGWDETTLNKIVKEWQTWCNTSQSLDTYEVTRCYKLCGFGKVKESWIHHFSDASKEGYGPVSFVRMVNCVGAIHCNFIMGSYSKEIYFYTSFRVDCSHVIRKDGNVLKERIKY